MKHVICTALVILGLVFQPFAVARTASVSSSDANSSMQINQTMTRIDVATINGHLMDIDSDARAMPCHETEGSNSGMDDCEDCCKKGCAMIAHCTATSSVSLAVLQYPYSLLELDSVSFKRRAMPLNAAAYITFIYHPPAHS